MMWIFVILIGLFVNHIESGLISTYLGCYSALQQRTTNATTTTPELCTSHCTSLNLPYSATRNGNECYCFETAANISSTPCEEENALSVVFTNILNLSASNSTKRGLCWFWDNPPVVYDYFSPKALTWLYNWQLFDLRKNGTFSEAEFVPMCATELDAHALPLVFSTCHAKYLLGFNEPDMPVSVGGSLISPYNASVLWKTYIQPLKEKCGLQLGAPAVSNSPAAHQGMHWLQEFFGNCTAPSCTFDFIPFHWYGNPLSNFQAYVEKFHAAYPKYPLWITEWQFGGISAEQTAIAELQALQWLDSQEYIARYSMFAPSTAELMNFVPNGAMVESDFSGLTDVGRVYAGLM